jgi:hypothetical protein
MSLDQPTATLLVGLVTAGVTISSWLAVHYFTRRREIESLNVQHQKEVDARKYAEEQEITRRTAVDERVDRLRRLDLLMQQTERQIREFYGPIYALVQQIWMVWDVKQHLLRRLSGGDNAESLEAVKARIEEFLGAHYFGPLHAEIRSILKDRLHLLEGVEMPDSFNEYLKHATMENVQQRLWIEQHISTKSVSGIRWNQQFPDDVKAGLDAAMGRYETYLTELRGVGQDRKPSA